MTAVKADRVHATKKTILIVDDHPVLRRGLAALIDSEPDLSVCREAATCAEALAAIRDSPRRNPSVVAVCEPTMEFESRRKSALMKDLIERQRLRRHPDLHRGRRILLPLVARLHVVPPHQPDRRPVQRSLATLRERDRLAFVVRAAVS